jgi:hypothetical protein
MLAIPSNSVIIHPSIQESDKKMFEITLTPQNTTKVRTDRGTFTIRYSVEHRRYQVFHPRCSVPVAESYNGLQGALDIVSQLAH